MTEMTEQMQQQMKKTLENLPRFDYKEIRFYSTKEEMQSKIDLLYNNAFMNLNSRTLTDNYIEELYELYIFMPKEGIYTLLASVIGAVLGGILGWLHGNTMISFALLNPVSAGGPVVSTVLGAGIGAITLAVFVAFLMLFKPIKDITPGMHMLTIYTDAERKKDLKTILNNNSLC